MKRVNLTTILVMGGMGIMLVTGLSVGGIGMLKSARSMETLSVNQVGTAAQSLSDMIQLSLLQEMNMLKELALDPSAVRAAARVEQEGTQSATAEIEVLQKKVALAKSAVGQNYELIAVGDVNGKVFADSEKGTLKGIDMSDRGYFKLVREGKYNLGEVVRSKSSGAPVLPIAAPIFSAENKVIGMLVIVLKIDYLLDTVTRAKIGQTGYAYILSRDGSMLAHRDKSLILKANINTIHGMEGIAKSIQAGKSGAETYIYQGSKKIAGYVQVGLTGWTVVVTQAYSDILAPIRSMQVEIILIGSLLMAVIALIVFFFGRKISRPITKVASGLSSAADQIVSASVQVSSAGRELSEGASEQAASIEETSSSLEEMSSMTQQNAESASQADQLMTAAREVVLHAGLSMDQLTTAMGEISTASEETSKIVRTIDEIAFQTNLLALNAAVEAARAGEAGAGFAVVADEVRNLAMRAGEASRNTAELIDGTIKRVREGSELAAKTGTDFQQVKESVIRFRELVGEIAAASREQARGIHQISKAVGDMESVVQQNAANAEEAASASEEMHAQSEHLKTYVQELIGLVGGSGDHLERAGVVRRAETLPGTVRDPTPPHRPHGPVGKVKSNGKDHIIPGSQTFIPGPALPHGREEASEF